MLKALKRMPALNCIESYRWDQLSPHISFKELVSGEVLFEAGSKGRQLYFIIDGELELFLGTNSDKTLDEPFYLHSRRKGDTAGDFAALNGGDHLVSAIAKKTTRVAVFPREAFELLSNIHPTLIESVYETAADLSHNVMVARIYLNLFGSMSKASMDELLEATEIRYHRNGDVLFQQGAEPDGLHMVVSGRLHVESLKSNGKTVFNGEIYAPEPVGEVAMLSGGCRTATVTAARESTVAFLHKDAFTKLVAEIPERLLAITQVVVRRQAQASDKRHRFRERTFVIVPLDPGLPMRRLSLQLKRELKPHTLPMVLDSRNFDKLYGRKDAAQTQVNDAFNSSISSWLEDKENAFGNVVYIADPSWTPWTRRCLHRADRVFFIADASKDGKLGGSGKCTPRTVETEVTSLFTNPHTTPKQELILLHPTDTELPSKTIHWLDDRKVEAFHHIRLDDSQHMARLARRLTGKARGVVLSGGGARGYAHLGVYRYMQEQDMPIDYVGGTSMGALLGASMALGSSCDTIMDLSSEFSNKKALFDYTLPLASLLKSRKLTAFCQTVFHKHRIEDLWIPFFCVSANLSSGQEVVHDRGSLWLAIRTTISLPGLFSPVPTDAGQLLTDGAVLNNFPVDVMRKRLGWQSDLIGVNVGQINELTHEYDFGTTLSGWNVFWSRLNPFQEARKTPRLVETLLRSADIKGLERLEELKNGLDILIEPDVSEISLLDFKAYAEIADIGYKAAQEAFKPYAADAPADGVVVEPAVASVMDETLDSEAANR